MDRLGQPCRGLLAILPRHGSVQGGNVSLEHGSPFLWVDAEIGEPPHCVALDGRDETVRLAGRSQRNPGSAGVHRGELPFAAALVLVDERTDHRLAFVEREQVLEDLHSLVVGGRGLDEEIQDRGQDLGGEDFVVDLD